MKDLLVQIDLLKANLKVKDEMIMGIKEIDFIYVIINYNVVTEIELAAFKEQSENKMEALQMDLKESQCINGMISTIIVKSHY